MVLPWEQFSTYLLTELMWDPGTRHLPSNPSQGSKQEFYPHLTWGDHTPLYTAAVPLHCWWCWGHCLTAGLSHSTRSRTGRHKMADFLKLGQFLPSASLKRTISTTAQLTVISENKHSFTVIMSTYKLAYIFILWSIVTYSNSYIPVNGDAYNSLLCLLEVWWYFSAQI